MKKLVLVLFIVVLVAGLMIPAIAVAHPQGQGKGCGCHRVADLMPGSVHTGFIASGGTNGGAAVCMKCH
jgi:hypothetical protein